MRFSTLLVDHADDQAPSRIGDALDAMTHEARLSTMRSITPSEQQQLWGLVTDRPIAVDHFVPAGTAAMKEVIHHGKNSLLAFNFFQKRFCLGDDGSGDLWGYNHNQQLVASFTGPGYFVAHGTADEKQPPGEYVIDYTRLPPKKPESWPKIWPNERRFSRLVYAGMKDYMRQVSTHVSIGRAHRRGKVMNAWFVLCREDPS